MGFVTKSKDAWDFFRAFLLSPRSIGSIMPSSRFLAKAMALEIHKPRRGQFVIELGAGTGALTQGLLEAGIDQEQIIVIERDVRFIQPLRARFPNVEVIKGDATCLMQLLLCKQQCVSSIISGLPLRLLGNQQTIAILDQIAKLLPVNGHYVQYTYDIRKSDSCYQPKCCDLTHSKIIWLNLPPAKIDVFTRRI